MFTEGTVIMSYTLQDYSSFIKSDFFNMGSIVSFIWNNDETWSVKAVSENIKHNYGYNASSFETAELVYANLIHKDDIKRVMDEVVVASKNKETSFVHEPYRVKNSDGKYRWVNDTTTIIYDSKKNITHFVGYILDITENEENLLRANDHEEKLKLAQSIANLGNWEYDLESKQLIWSDEIYNIFELDKDTFEVSYSSFLDAIHPEDKERVNEAYRNSLVTREKYTIQHRLLMPDGRVKHVEERCENYFDEEQNPLRSLGTIQDITHQKEIEVQLQKTISSFQSHQLAMDESSVVSKSDLKGNITYVNENFCKLTGYSKEEVIGKAHNLLRHPDNKKEIFENLWKTISSKKVWKMVLKNKNKNGQTYWVDTSILPITDENDEIVEYIAVRHDVTQMILQQEQLDKIANTDILTGLGNRYKLLNDIKRSVSPALAIINLDNFAQINDFYGHEVGDYIIKEFGEKLYEHKCSKSCHIYHLQGDEYVIFHKNINKDTFVSKMESIEKKLSEIKISVKGENISFNFTMSISFESKETILSSANMALKIAKRDNKSLVVYENSISLNDEYKNNIKCAKKIKDAIANENITPVFQPIVNNLTNQWEKYESLVRLRDGEKLISPYFFLDIAKKTKHYKKITQIMIKKSFEMFQDKELEFSLNLTIEDLLDDDIKEYIFDMLETYQVGSRLVIEIVESESIENFEEVMHFINKVKSYGCKIAIDDFGTGYSNFEYLMKLKVDYIKIDGSMIKDIDTNKDAQVIVSIIVDFAKRMGIKVIAEFVENESILNKVKELGIEYSQGYHFSMPKEELASD